MNTFLNGSFQEFTKEFRNRILLKANPLWIMKNNTLGNSKEIIKCFLNNLGKNWILLRLSLLSNHSLSKKGMKFLKKVFKTLKI